MSFAFDPHQGLVTVHAEIWGPSGSAVLSLALDTGATFTLVNQGRLMQLGYDPAVAPKRFQVHRKRSRVRAPVDRHEDRSFGTRAERLSRAMPYASGERESRWVARVGLLSRAKLKY